MSTVEEVLDQAVKGGKIPHGVVFATNKNGSFTLSAASGTHPHPSDPRPANADNDVFLLASSTKLMTSIAAIQLIERGLIGLDEDVAQYIPTLASQPILEGFDAQDKPVFKERKNVIKFKHLLTHTSGAAYHGGDPMITKLQTQRGQTPNVGSTVEERFGYPLAFEPGTQFAYGPSMDWAGKVIERVSGHKLDEYCQAHIWAPLGLTGISFWAHSRPELGLEKHITQLTVRTPEGALVPWADPFINTGSVDAFGGHGAYARLADYAQVMQSLLANDGRLVKPASVETMFTPQLSDVTRASLAEFIKTPVGACFIGDFNKGIKLDWGIGGVLFLETDDGFLKKGTLSWGGVTNTFWTIDREADLALVFGTSVLPPGDLKVEEVISAIQKAVYSKAGVKL